jgi:DUF4097 and DUF4098 domain-containing protein YvlB
MSRKVGRITLAATLMVAGGIILFDNLMGTEVAWYIGRLWAAILIFLGLEWIATATRAEREGIKATFDAGAIVGLVIVAIIASNVSSWGRAPRFIMEARNRPNINVEIAVPQIEVPPLVMPPIAPPVNPFGSVSAEAVTTELIDVGRAPNIVLSTSSSNVTVQDGPQATVEMRVRAYGRSKEEAEQVASTVRLDVRQVGDRTTIGSLAMPQTNRTEVSFVVTLPKHQATTLNVTSSSGGVNVADRAGSVTVNTSSGAIRAERIDGNVDLRSNSGTVIAVAVKGDVAATSTSGGVQVEAVSGNAKVSATSGSVILRDVSGRVSAQSSSGSVTIDTETVGGDYDVSAVSGAVHVTVPTNAGVNVTARASSGRVTGPAWLTIGEGRNSGSGAQGDGAHKLNLRTTSGSISLEVR